MSVQYNAVLGFKYSNIYIKPWHLDKTLIVAHLADNDSVDVTARELVLDMQRQQPLARCQSAGSERSSLGLFRALRAPPTRRLFELDSCLRRHLRCGPLNRPQQIVSELCVVQPRVRLSRDDLLARRLGYRPFIRVNKSRPNVRQWRDRCVRRRRTIRMRHMWSPRAVLSLRTRPD